MSYSRRRGTRFRRGRSPERAAGGGGGGGDVDPPGVSSLAMDPNGLFIDLTVDEPSDQLSTPPAAAFAFGGTTLATPGTPAWQSATVIRIPTVGRFLLSETVTLSYTAGASPIQDLAGNDLPNFSGAAVVNVSLYEAEMVLDTFLADWSLADTDYLIGHPATALIHGAGGGGDGGVTNGATGGGGELRILAIAAMAAGGYSGTIGAKGVAGTAGTATAGTASTLTGPSGLLATANGGGGGNSVGPTGGAGGTGGSGGTGRDGGAGSGGTGNRAGGGTSGSSTAAVGATPGEPEGNPGMNGDSHFPGRGVGGAVRTGTPLTGRDGGDGVTRLICMRAVVALSRTYVASMGYGRDATNGTARNVAFGGTHVANDRGLVAAAQDGTAGGASMAGYTELLDAGNTAIGLVYVRDLDNGPDPVSLATASEQVSWQAYRIRNAASVAAWTLTSAAVSSTTTPDPPSHNQGSVVDGLWFVGCATDLGNTALGLSAWPAGYESRMALSGAANLNGANLATCSLPLLATQTQDPGTFTTALAGTGRVWTMCVPKA
jgi:hypothetical protein